METTLDVEVVRILGARINEVESARSELKMAEARLHAFCNENNLRVTPEGQVVIQVVLQGQEPRLTFRCINVNSRGCAGTFTGSVGHVTQCPVCGVKVAINRVEGEIVAEQV